MKIEASIMERFVEILNSDESLLNPLLNRHQVYRDMVYHRFFETITNIYPMLTSRLGDQMHELIRAFQSRGAMSVLMSDMAYEFGEFLKEYPIEESLPYLEDLLWLEWGEAELAMSCFDGVKASFEWKKSYRLSPSARIRVLKYPVYRRDFETLGEYPLALYYHFGEDRVYFEEMTPLAYDLLGLLEQSDLQTAVEEIARRYEVDVEDIKEPIEELLGGWCEKNILTDTAQYSFVPSSSDLIWGSVG